MKEVSPVSDYLKISSSPSSPPPFFEWEEVLGAIRFHLQVILLVGNDIGRCSHNILFVRQAFEHALCTLCAVFIRPREHSPIWKSHYNGSLLAHIVIISARHIRYRNWLRGRVLSDGNVSSSLSKTSTPEACMSVTLNTSILSQPGVVSHCNHSSLCASPHCLSTSATTPRSCSCVATVEDAKSPRHTPT